MGNIVGGCRRSLWRRLQVRPSKVANDRYGNNGAYCGSHRRRNVLSHNNTYFGLNVTTNGTPEYVMSVGFATPRSPFGPV